MTASRRLLKLIALDENDLSLLSTMKSKTDDKVRNCPDRSAKEKRELLPRFCLSVKNDIETARENIDVRIQ
jgi:hypothetical protein